MDELKKYEVIKGLADHPQPNKERAALTLGCTIRHINRMLAGYKTYGKVYFVHGNKGRQPANTIQNDVKITIIDLYRSKYYDANFTHFTELLDRHEGISLSVSSVSKILESEYILSPKVTRAKHKRIIKHLKDLKKAAKTQTEADAIQTNLVAAQDAHTRRPRAAYFGELLQMDATSYEWIPGSIWHLHLAIDDATGRIVGAWFDTQETLNGYYHVFQQILTDYGIPYKFFTDRRTVFTYKKKNSPSLDEDTYTQFAYACHQLGVELESSSIPQAKGRVERFNQTLQSRLPIELRLAGITTIEAANEFLNLQVKEFNAKFSLPFNTIKSVFEEQPSNEKINLTLATLCERTVDTGHCLRHSNSYYKMLDKNGLQVHYRKGTRTMFIQAFDGKKYCCVNDADIYALEAIPEHEAKSKNLDLDYKEPKPKKKYIPPMNHPWRKSIFHKFVQKQEHHWDDEEKASA
ncbi:ISNCY family transposase [Eisenbergiella sp.]|uniref:ISNCY family transposase n=1 Tax=Eisenbergiella sp. TaxID=1924109 RepID=UPI002080A062|nr:ISNCY family transposase [Eisenbergiella sp.]BDF43309.1 transposase [Lachnospiraceae bacterium]BDF43575.1 transposase [Lachnospiraceae bacterium]BDF48933.1 transposase [Lachnospiraceae bacterium]GKH39459.1 transposase [Lachnospiraceae bacterium]GKH45012.1 transposase [Lachnospiraceae bacterium]